MKCPSCHEDNDRVIDSRASHDGFATRRRRVCSNCGLRYTTYERIEGTRQPFDPTKIKRGLELACWKRPVSDAQLESIVMEVQNELESHSDPEIESREVGELVMKFLRAVDQVAYVRFASVYRQFEDVHDFVHELKPMLAEAKRREERERS
jgi:transcriptional repressor NrdR